MRKIGRIFFLTLQLRMFEDPEESRGKLISTIVFAGALYMASGKTLPCLWRCCISGKTDRPAEEEPTGSN